MYIYYYFWFYSSYKKKSKTILSLVSFYSQKYSVKFCMFAIKCRNKILYICVKYRYKKNIDNININIHEL